MFYYLFFSSNFTRQFAWILHFNPLFILIRYFFNFMKMSRGFVYPILRENYIFK